MMRAITATGAIAFLLVTMQASIAQQQDRQTRPGQQPGFQAGQGSDLQEKLAACLILGNMAEVKVSQLATEKATDQQVRQFAEQMVQEHTQLIEQLRKFAPNVSFEQQGQQQEQRPRTTATQQPGAAGGGAAGSDPFFRIGKEAAQREVQMLVGMLQDKQGQQFDQAYTGQQILQHICMLAELQAIEQSGAAGELQPLVSKAIQATEAHLQHVTQLCEKLEGAQSGTERLSRRPQQQQPPQQQQQPPRQE
jgi:predicted outer membrane protein